MCKCGCNTCETKGPLLTEGKVKSLLSEGLQYHIDKKIPLFETVYRIGSKKHLSLIKEARKMYSRNVIDLCEEDEALIKTHLGEFALYEGVSIPLDLPMLNEIDEDDEYEIASRNLFDMTWDEVRRQNNQDMVQDVHDEVSKDDEEDWDDDDNIYTLRESKMPTQDQVDKFFALTQNEMHYLNSKPVAGQEGTFNLTKVKPWDEYDLSNWNSLVRKAKSKGQLNEDRKYNQEELLKLDLIARRKFDCDYEKCTDEQKDEILKDKVKVGVKEMNNLGYKGKEFVFILLNKNNQSVLVKGETDSYKAYLKIVDKMGSGTDPMLYSIDGRKLEGFGGIEPRANQDFDSGSYDDVINEKLKGIDGKACWKGYKLAGTKKKGGKTVDNCVPMEEAKQDIYDKFLDNPSSPKGRAKSLILKFTKEYGDDASSMAVDRFASKNNLKPEEKYILKYITKNDIKISSQSGGPDFSAVSEAEMKEDGFPDKFTSDEDIVYLKMKEDSRGAHYNLYYKGYDIEFGGIRFGTVKSLMDYSLQRIVSRQTADKLRFEDAKPLPTLDEAEFKGKEVALNKPKRGGPKAYYVYVKDGDKVKKVTFGSGGLRAKIKNKEARNAFAARHKCSTKKDRTKAGYWSCNLPRYAPALGLGAKMNTFW
jgi:hypothetical protein